MKKAAIYIASTGVDNFRLQRAGRIVTNSSYVASAVDGAVNRRPSCLLLFMLLQALMLGACSTVIPYQPTANLSRDVARSILRQAFEEQAEDMRPVLVEIGDDAIRLGFTAINTRLGANRVAIETRETYYFSNLVDRQLIKRKGRWQINIQNKEYTSSRWVYFYSEKKATDFLDAISRMSSNGWNK